LTLKKKTLTNMLLTSLDRKKLLITTKKIITDFNLKKKMLVLDKN